MNLPNIITILRVLSIPLLVIFLRFSAEIVGADSMQIFRHLDIGTAKPTLEERKKVVHHLVDVVDPDEEYHAGRYAEESLAACRAIIKRKHASYCRGGTRLYLRALLEGMFDALPVDKNIRKIITICLNFKMEA